jgi:hypothetical protein
MAIAISEVQGGNRNIQFPELNDKPQFCITGHKEELHAIRAALGFYYANQRGSKTDLVGTIITAMDNFMK